MEPGFCFGLVNIGSFVTLRFRGGAARSGLTFGLFSFGVGNVFFFGPPGGVGNFVFDAPPFGAGKVFFGPPSFGVGNARPEGFSECRPPTFLGSDFILFPDLVKVAFRFERSVGPQTRRFGRGP